MLQFATKLLSQQLFQFKYFVLFVGMAIHYIEIKIKFSLVLVEKAEEKLSSEIYLVIVNTL